MFLLKRGLLEVQMFIQMPLPLLLVKMFFPIEVIELLKSCFLIVAHPLLHHRQRLQVQRCSAELLWPARRAYEVQHWCLQEIQQICQHRGKGTGNNKMWRNKSCCLTTSACLWLNNVPFSVPGVPHPDQQLSSGLQHACPLYCPLTWSVWEPDRGCER